MTSTDELESQIHAQDCELEYWFQQAENYAEVQIPADDLRAIIARTYSAVSALPELLERVRRLEGALETIAKSKYGKCPIEGHWPPEKPCTLCGDLGFFDDDPQYNPSKDGHCVEGGARVVARAALNREPGQ